MAFSFTVETGVGDPDANSYVDVVYADDYIYANFYAASTWDALDEETKQRFLVRASKYLDTMVDWNGEKSVPESGLRWPRSGVYDADGLAIPDDVIPQQLMDATCELASILQADDWTQTSSTRGMKEIQVDVIELKFDASFERGSMPNIVVDMLDGLGTVKSTGRTAFKKIIRH